MRYHAPRRSLTLRSARKRAHMPGIGTSSAASRAKDTLVDRACGAVGHWGKAAVVCPQRDKGARGAYSVAWTRHSYIVAFVLRRGMESAHYARITLRLRTMTMGAVSECDPVPIGRPHQPRRVSERWVRRVLRDFPSAQSAVRFRSTL